MKRRDFIKNSVGLAGILAAGKFPNILYGQVESSKLVTDSVIKNMAARLKLDVNKGDITFEADYDIPHDMFSNPDYHPFSKLYAINKGDQQGAAIQVMSGLPMVRQTDGAKCSAKLQKIAGKYRAAENMFDLIIDQGVIHAVPLNDQPGGIVTTGDYVEWNPVLKLDGNTVNSVSGPVLLSIDPVNTNYSNNTLEWDYGICLRRIRIIEGRILERWTFFSNPGGEIRIEHNHRGKASFRIGGPGIDILDGDIEVITKQTFDEAEYPFEISASSTFYPTDGSYEDGQAFENTAAIWPTIRGDVGDAASDDSASNYVFFIQSYQTVDKWVSLYRSFLIINTASIPDGDTVSAAELSLYGDGGTAKTDECGIASRLVVVASNPANDDSIVAGDYDSRETTAFSGTVTYASWNDAGYNAFTFNAAGRAAINKIGATKLAVVDDVYDRGGSTPTHPGTNGLRSWVRGFWVEQGVGFKPKLAVTHAPLGIAITIDTKDGAADLEKIDGVGVADVNKIDGKP